MHNLLVFWLTLLFVLLLLPKVSAQNFTVSGTLKDASSGEDLIGATVIVKEKPTVGTAANTYGFYSLTLPKGEYTLLFRYIGFDPLEQKITLDHDLRLNRELASETGLAISEVVIKSEKENKNVSNTEMSVTKLDPKDVENIPVIFGEKDIIKTLQLTPGVKSAGDGNAGFYVRGGAIDQNLILLDEAPVYNASHLLGFFSVFNSDALKDVTLYKGTMPAEFGGRGCLFFNLGCQGPNTLANCNSDLWNRRSSKPRAGVPCFGCTSPGFPKDGNLFRTEKIGDVPAALPLGVSRAHYIAYKNLARAAMPLRIKNRDMEP